jgi:1-phosphofructokinase
MILTVTPNPAVDQTIKMPEELEGDVVLRSIGSQFDSGGNGINVSQFLERLGNGTLATGFVGGFTGYFLEEDLAEFGVETDFVEIPATTRMNTTILTPEQEYKINQSGPEVDAGIVDELIDTILAHDPEIVYIGGSLPPGLDASDVDRISAAGDWETAIDVPGGLLPELEETYEYCKPNKAELAAATGMEVSSIDSVTRAARELQGMGFERVIASLGGEGAMIVSPTETLYATALDVDVVDTVGAGDSLLAAVLWASKNGWDDETALRAGVAASSQLVSITGTSIDDLSPQETMDDVTVWSLRPD